jgi:hypothetical protein
MSSGQLWPSAGTEHRDRSPRASVSSSSCPPAMMASHVSLEGVLGVRGHRGRVSGGQGGHGDLGEPSSVRLCSWAG